jgi:ligand-binding SRPBCC domain-containing protein
MSVYERSTRLPAPLSAVWDFHSTTAGLVAVTPDWMQMRVETVRGPDGETLPTGDDANAPILVEGSEVDLSVRPFGVGPRQSWTSRIVERRIDDDTARFVDEMVAGPFADWTHTHSFQGAGDATVMTDRVEYRLPGGTVGGAVSPLAVVGFEPMFRFRHRRTRRLLG